MALHSGPGCKMSDGTVHLTGTIMETDCDSTVENSGCSVRNYNSTCHGSNFNNNGGGIYVTEIDQAVGVSIWYFPRGHFPADITNPATYGAPLGFWSASTCNIAEYFKQMALIINTSFCGEWGNPDYSGGACTSTGQSCQDYVTNNPESFKESYWGINSLRVYQKKS